MADIPQFIRQMPKVELHAHLNGSISYETFQNVDLLNGRQFADECSDWMQHYKSVLELLGKPRNLAECFTLFHGIHGVIDSTEDVRKVTCQVIKEFSDDNVSYLELRSTPRAFSNSSKEEYIDAVVSGIETCKQQLPIIVKFLVSIDRSQGLQAAHEALDLARKCAVKYPGIVVGMDLSGNPRSGNGSDYVSILREAKSLGFKLSLHVAEVIENEDENFQLLSVLPDRIGHGTYIHPCTGGCLKLKEIVTKHKIPLEICPTSNVMTQAVASYENLHFKYWFQENHPCIICTDDKGVFDTTLSEEYAHVYRAFQLSESDIWQLAYQGIESIFDGEDIKEHLRKNFDAARKSYSSQ